MKKIIAFALLGILLSGCEKDADKNNDLVGTKWMTTGYSPYMSFLLGGTWNKWYEFTSNTTLDCYWTDNNGNIIDSDGEMTYSYDFPSLSVTEKDGGVSKFQFQDKRSFYLITIDGTPNKSVCFYKQQ